MSHHVQLLRTRRQLLAYIPVLAMTSAVILPVPGRAQADAAAMLKAAATKMSEVKSFHFELSTPRGETTVGGQFTLLELSGDVVRPDSFRATAKVDAMVAKIDLTIIGIHDQLWVSDPLGGAGSYQTIDLGGDAAAGRSFTDLINPDRLLLSAVDTITEPVIAGQDEIDGVMTTRINGTATLSFRMFGALATTPIAGEVLSDKPLQVAVWIDDSSLVRQLDIYGPLLEGEAANTVRRLRLSAFDTEIEITPPTPTAG